MRPLIKNSSSGFALLPVIYAALIGIILAYGITSLFFENNRQVKILEQRLERVQVEKILASFVQSDKKNHACGCQLDPAQNPKIADQLVFNLAKIPEANSAIESSEFLNLNLIRGNCELAKTSNILFERSQVLTSGLKISRIGVQLIRKTTAKKQILGAWVIEFDSAIELPPIKIEQLFETEQTKGGPAQIKRCVPTFE